MAAVPPAIVDSHVHVWDSTRFPLPWLGSAPPYLRPQYQPSDFRAATNGIPVVATVWVQAGDGIEERRWLLEQAAVQAVPTVVVGSVELASLVGPGAIPAAERLKMLKSSPLGSGLVGVRASIRQREGAFLLRPDVQDGLTAISQSGMVLDLLIRHDQMSSAAQIAARHELTLVVDHLGLPEPHEYDAAVQKSWLEGIRRLGDTARVVLKISGVADWSTPAHRGALADAVMAGFEAFGGSRVMFGSDWPMSTAEWDYLGVVEATAELVERAVSDTDLEALWAGTATQIYGLKPG